MRKKIIIGNWKMYKTATEAAQFMTVFNQTIAQQNFNCDYGIAASYTNLTTLLQHYQSPFIVAAQNCHWLSEGAMTGEISTAMLTDLKVQYVIIGHSERRQFFHETDNIINQKLLQIIRHSAIVPILCCGETLTEMTEKQTNQVIETQITNALKKLSNDEISKIVIAYEPIWAIGTGKTATAEQAQTICQMIRQLLAKLTNQTIANQVRIQYGGSVKPDNIKSFLSQPDIDGALVGSASLKVDDFINLLVSAEKK